MEILIIEDEQPAARRLEQMLSGLLPLATISAKPDSVQTAVAWLQTHPEPDLIFLDIQLADGLSFKIFEQVTIRSPVIFCTAYDQYAIKAFKLNSIDYLLKPVDPEELQHALRKFQSHRNPPVLSLEQIQSLLQPLVKTYKTRFLVKLGERIQFVTAADIAFFYSEEKVTFLQTRAGRRFIVDFTLDQLEQLLDPRVFFRLNRKYISSLGVIKDIFTYSNSRLKIHLHGCEDNDIFISREKVAAFKAWLDQ